MASSSWTFQWAPPPVYVEFGGEHPAIIKNTFEDGFEGAAGNAGAHALFYPCSK